MSVCSPSRLAFAAARAAPVSLLIVACLGCTSVHSPSATDGRASPAADGVPQRSEPAAPGPQRLRLATWNLEWLNAAEGRGVVPRMDSDFARLAAMAGTLGADVIAVQEVEGVEAAARVFDPAVYAFHFTQQGGVQRVGFAYRKELRVQPMPDYTALDVGGLRAGADLRVEWAGGSLRLLSVHLKSGCFDGALGRSDACSKLARQLPHLEAWVDARAVAGEEFAVLGDFNRRLFATPDDPFWRELDDSVPAESDLSSPTEVGHSQCWGGAYPEYIDHLVFSRSAAKRIVAGSFSEVLFAETDLPDKAGLSDHCPLRVELGDAAAAAGLSVERHLESRKVSVPQSVVLRFGVAPSATSAASDTTESRQVRQRHGLIKGNHGKRGVKLYHLPNCPNYNRVDIDLSAGERWFETETAARAAGFRKAGDCP